MAQAAQGGTTMPKRAFRLTAGVLAGMLLLLAFSGTAAAESRQLVTLTMDDLAMQPVDDLVERGGVRFDFKINGVDSSDATYGGFGPGATVFVTDPSIEGDTSGVLTVSFAHPTDVVRFGLATTFEQTVTVRVYNPGGRLKETVVLDTESIVSFPEAEFVHEGGAVGKIAVSFGAGFGRFAFDNLTFRAPPQA